MPDFTVEVTSKTSYGPFTYPSPSDLRDALVSGRLDLSAMVLDADCPTSIKIKEIKEPK